jgi:hypothetical protein
MYGLAVEGTTTWPGQLVNKVIATIEQVLADSKARAWWAAMPAELVNRVATVHKDPGVLGVAERVDWTTHCCLLKLNRRSSDPPCRQTHTRWAAKSAACCLSSGAQPSYTLIAASGNRISGHRRTA